MSDIKVFKIKKTVPGDILFVLHPLSNTQLSRTIYLTDRNPVQVLPEDWALGIFMDNGIYNMYKTGYFTFEDNKAAVKAAYEAGAYFDEVLDFEPVSENHEEVILGILKSGNRANIVDSMKKYGDESVRNVAIMHVNDLTAGVVKMLEGIFHVQLIVDGDENPDNE